MKNIISIVATFLTSVAISQPIRLHIMGGLANNTSDIQQKSITLSQATTVITGGGTFNITDKIALRGDYSFAKLGADDKKSTKPYLLARNLNFKTVIQELSLTGEYDLWSLYDKPFTPYVFGGIGLFHFSPYTYNAAGNKVWLSGLSTEGQGFPEYSGRKPYKRTQFNIPFGGGLKYALSEDVYIGGEIGIRKLFTDYLDDVSLTYVDENLLRQKKGSKAVEVAFRGDELKTNPRAYPAAGSIRGSASSKDYYYFAQFRISFRMNWFENLSGNRTSFRSSKRGMGCPSWK